MSYILDALKKSDKERQQGEVPGIDSIHDRFPSGGHHSPGTQKNFLPMAVAIILFVSIPLAAWYWYTDFYRPDEKIVVINEVISPVTPPDVKVKDQVPTVTPPAPLPNINTTVLKIPKPESIRQEPEKEMALLQREKLPELHFAGHTYSDDPAKRMIIINDTILREGQRVDESITLTEITWTGVILDYNGQRIEMMIE